GWQFLQKRFKRKIDGLRGVEHGSKKLTHRTSPLIFKGLSAMLALMGIHPVPHVYPPPTIAAPAQNIPDGAHAPSGLSCKDAQTSPDPETNPTPS
ncbi:hypothetical protein, partial [uncultured Thiocystis sp.]|uniref:hypothetical protein n=1 Tax=uncultured Thiocystis sp. TaxID=1202134 RepID=UPI0025D7F836